MSGAPRTRWWPVGGASRTRWWPVGGALRTRWWPVGGALRARLQPHLPGELDPAQLTWWAPRGWAVVRCPPWRAGRRDAALAEVTAQLAALVALGCSMPDALHRVVRDGAGTAVAEVALADGWVRDGMPAVTALRRAARAAGCDATGRLAAAAAAGPEDLLPRLRGLASALARRAHDRRAAVLDVLVWIVWLAVALAAAVTLRDLATL